jgi:hypothetical protein
MNDNYGYIYAYDESTEDEEDDKTNQHEEEDDVITMLRQQEQTLTEQKNSNINKYKLIIDKMKDIEEKEEALKEQLRALNEEKNRLRIEAHDKAIEENKAIQIKLDKVKATIAIYSRQMVKKPAERKSSGEVVKTKSSTFFSRMPLNEMVNQDTRFIYEQKKGCVFKRFCLISKSENCVYECDEHGGMIKGQVYRSLNDFCVAVKKSVNYQGSLKQDTSVVLKYYDISSGEYKSYKDLTSPLN